MAEVQAWGPHLHMEPPRMGFPVNTSFRLGVVEGAVPPVASPKKCEIV
jgi:hypothetical protein